MGDLDHFSLVLGNVKVLYFEMDFQLISACHFICVQKCIKLEPSPLYSGRLLNGELSMKYLKPIEE